MSRSFKDQVWTARRVNAIGAAVVLTAPLLGGVVAGGCSGDSSPAGGTENADEGPVGEAVQAVQPTCLTVTRPSGIVADSTIAFDATNAALANTNFGADPALFAGTYVVGGTRRSLLRFDLGAIPSASTVSSATLKLKSPKVLRPGPGLVNVHPLSGAWTEGTVTWNNAPAFGATAASFHGAQGPNIVPLPVALAQGWVSTPASNNGVLLEQLSSQLLQFRSSEHTQADDWPSLTVCYVPNSCQGAPDGTPCNDGNACTTGEVCQGNACVGASSVVCQALDACHDVGTCNPSTGVCDNPPKAVGAPCDDGNACTTGDTCKSIPCNFGESVLWVGHDGAAFTKQSSFDGSLLQTLSLGGTGTAWDGTNLYFTSPGGILHTRNSLALVDINSYALPAFGHPTEDLTWDTTRQRLWRVDHNPPTLVRINPVTQMVDATYPLSSGDPNGAIVPRGTLGVAYDTLRDKLYVSFCRAGCSSATIGEVIVVDPNNGAELATSFYANGFMTGGLAYDSLTDTVWVGSNVGLVHMTLAGATITTLPNQGGGFPDGVEYIPSCNSGQVQCQGTPSCGP